MNDHPSSAEKNLQALAGEAHSQLGANQNLANAALQGNLPGGAMVALQQALESAKATIRSNFAAMGLSGSSQEASALANAEASSIAEQFQIGQQIAQTGLSQVSADMNLSDDLYSQILNADTARGSAVGTSIANFMKAVSV
jgi:hypothetical protein